MDFPKGAHIEEPLRVLAQCEKAVKDTLEYVHENLCECLPLEVDDIVEYRRPGETGCLTGRVCAIRYVHPRRVVVAVLPVERDGILNITIDVDLEDIIRVTVEAHPYDSIYHE